MRHPVELSDVVFNGQPAFVVSCISYTILYLVRIMMMRKRILSQFPFGRGLFENIDYSMPILVSKGYIGSHNSIGHSYQDIHDTNDHYDNSHYFQD